MTTAFPKTPHKVLTVVIDEHGQLEYLKTDSCDILLELGETVTRRASHVFPARFWHRQLFQILRRLFGDRGRTAQWTRGWRTEWYVDTKPVGGPVLTWGDVWEAKGDCQDWMRQMPMYKVKALWSNRQSAIDAEVAFLNEFFLTR